MCTNVYEPSKDHNDIKLKTILITKVLPFFITRPLFALSHFASSRFFNESKYYLNAQVNAIQNKLFLQLTFLWVLLLSGVKVASGWSTKYGCNGLVGCWPLACLSLFSVISLDKDLVLWSGIILTPNLVPKIERQSRQRSSLDHIIWRSFCSFSYSRLYKRKLQLRNIVDYTKTSKKRTRHYSRDY